MVYAGNAGSGWRLVGAAPVATGTRGKFDHYITPLGVFDHAPAGWSDYRAAGTKNSKGIRGYGRKGMRVWDLGWTRAEKGWLRRTEEGPIRLQVHATAPDVLEPRLGTPGSKGCVRIPASLNVFLGRHAMLDYHIEQGKGGKPWCCIPTAPAAPFRTLPRDRRLRGGQPTWLGGPGHRQAWQAGTAFDGSADTGVAP